MTDLCPGWDTGQEPEDLSGLWTLRVTVRRGPGREVRSSDGVCTLSKGVVTGFPSGPAPRTRDRP